LTTRRFFMTGGTPGGRSGSAGPSKGGEKNFLKPWNFTFRGPVLFLPDFGLPEKTKGGFFGGGRAFGGTSYTVLGGVVAGALNCWSFWGGGGGPRDPGGAFHETGGNCRVKVCTKRRTRGRGGRGGGGHRGGAGGTPVFWVFFEGLNLKGMRVWLREQTFRGTRLTRGPRTRRAQRAPS